jgi:hypothetical protein
MTKRDLFITAVNIIAWAFLAFTLVTAANRQQVPDVPSVANANPVATPSPTATPPN